MTTPDFLPFSRRVLALSVAFLAPIIVAPAAGLQFAGVPVSPGGTVQAEVPMNAQEKSYAAEGGNTVPDKAVAVVAFPPGFTPQKTWPILVVFSTSDFRRLNRNDLVDFYRDTALAEGWVVLAGDGPEFPRKDSSGWRAAMTLAALDAFHKSFPGSIKWPVACAGFSGGAKRVGLIAPILSLAGARISGIYMTGINEDRLTQGYKQYHLGKAFLNTPVFISSGQQDKIALPEQQRGVKLSLERTGFQRVRLETFPQGHAVKRDHVREALRWFRSSAGSS